MAAAVRLARVATGRDRVLGCGYHGWLDWCQTGDAAGTPSATRALYGEVPFNDPDQTRELIRLEGDRLAAVVFEPVILRAPHAEWLEVLREETLRSGALLVVDEIKAVCRLAIGGGCERFGIRPDLVVLGKALANGFPLAAVGGRSEVMDGVGRTWISSTLATEFVSLAAARATLDIMDRQEVPAHLGRVGARLLAGLERLAQQYPGLVSGAGGLPEMCLLHFRDDECSRLVAAECSRRGLLFKRSAYNFVSLAHDESVIERTLEVLEEVCVEVARGV
jgi:glutamate-1-semialdehyde 2,1-aminomutase